MQFIENSNVFSHNYSGGEVQGKDISTLGEALLLLVVPSKYPHVAERTEVKGDKHCASTQQGLRRVSGGTGKVAQSLRVLVI